MAAEKRVVFKSPWLPYLLVAPQMVITLVFFFWPATQALYQSLLVEDAFGTATQFVGRERDVFHRTPRRFVSRHSTELTFEISRAGRLPLDAWPNGS